LRHAPLRLARICSLCWLGWLWTPLSAAPSPPDAARLEAPAGAPAAEEGVPTRAGLRIGRLANGLTYYVQRNALPKERVEIRLAVDVGSVDEEDGERGFAHFLEHLAFRSTRHFPAGQLAPFLAAAGLQQGADLNATTSYEETIYRLRLPTTDPAVLRRGFELVADWAGGLTLTDTEVEKERGAVLAEWSSRRTAASRTFDRHLPVLLAGTRYPSRPPLGDRAVLAGATAAALTRFYQAWYRPERIAVVAVGDLDPAAAEAQIRAVFSTLPTAVAAVPRATRERLPERTAPRASVATDPETPQALISLAFSRPAEPVFRVGEYRRRLTKFLFHRVLNQRLAEVAQQPEAPFVLARSSEIKLVRGTTTTVALALFEPGRSAPALASLVGEIRGIAEGGVGAEELSRHRADLLRDMESAAAEEDRTDSVPLAEECIRHFLDSEPLPSLTSELRLAQRLLPGIQPADVQAFAAEAAPLARAVVLLTEPGKPAVSLPAEPEILRALAAARALPIRTRLDPPSPPLLAATPAPGRIVATREIASLGVSEWTLGNGIKVIAKPTDFKRDEVLFTSFRSGGFAGVPDRDLVPAWTAAEAVRLGGVGNLDLPALGRALAGKAVEVSPFLRERTAGISGRSSRTDLAVGFQLLHLYLTSPRADAGAFAAYRNRLKDLLANRSDPEALLDDAEDTMLTGGDPRHRRWDAGIVEEMNLDRSMAIYRDLLGNPEGYTFVFVGSFDPRELAELARTYLGSLPALARPSAAAVPLPPPPHGPAERVIAAGTEPRSSVRLIFAGALRWMEPDRTALLALAEILSTRLQQRLRGDLGALYQVDVDSKTNRDPSPNYQIRVRFSCAPERVDDLVRTVLDEIVHLRTSGPAVADLASWKQVKLQKLQDELARNAFWLNALKTAYALGDDPASILGTGERLQKLTPEALRDAAVCYLDPQGVIKLVASPAGDLKRSPGATERPPRPAG
jgi:zinc protease